MVEAWVLSLIISPLMGALGSTLMWLFLGKKMIRKHGPDALIQAIAEPDERTKKAVSALLTMIMQTPVKTGKKLRQKDEKGEVVGEEDEVLPFSRFMLREIADFSLMKFKAFMGGTSAQLGNDIQEEIGDAKFKMLTKFRPRRKNQSVIEYVMEIVAEHPEVLDKFKNAQKDASAAPSKGW